MKVVHLHFHCSIFCTTPMLLLIGHQVWVYALLFCHVLHYSNICLFLNYPLYFGCKIWRVICKEKLLNVFLTTHIVFIQRWIYAIGKIFQYISSRRLGPLPHLHTIANKYLFISLTRLEIWSILSWRHKEDNKNSPCKEAYEESCDSVLKLQGSFKRKTVSWKQLPDEKWLINVHFTSFSVFLSVSHHL